MKKISKPLFYLLLSLLLLLLGYKMPIAAAASIPIVANVSTNSNSPEAAVAQALVDICPQLQTLERSSPSGLIPSSCWICALSWEISTSRFLVLPT